MLPIEPVFEAIATYWHQNYQQECYPEIAGNCRISELIMDLRAFRNSRCFSTLSKDDKCLYISLQIRTKTAKSFEDAPDEDSSLLESQPGMSPLRSPPKLGIS